MESLADETWDLVIAGTGLVQALLALSLSRSDLKILHVDKNSYYGGADAGLSLDEAKSWARENEPPSEAFSSAQVHLPHASSTKLAASRAYTLSLNPQIVYAQSQLLPRLVSSTVNTQLEFLAVGSWWICKDGKLQKVPSSREDVFADDGLSRRDKMGLMKLLRHVVQDGSEDPDAQPDVLDGSFESALTSKFRLSPSLQLPISALALTPQSVHDTPTEPAIQRIRRHMRSMGYFGPGFGAVVAKYAGNAEIAQVCCRACAVGGATYLLGQGVADVATTERDESIEVKLDNGVTVRAKHLVSSIDSCPQEVISSAGVEVAQPVKMSRSISVVSSPLRHLFPQTSENGPVPATAIVTITDGESEEALTKPPIYLQVHSEDTGECPSGQCVVYASTLCSDNATSERLTSAVQKLLAASAGGESMETEPEDDATRREVLWSMSYTSKGSMPFDPPGKPFMHDTGQIIVFPPTPQDIAFDDSILASVEAVWRKVLGDKADELEFLRFEDRLGNSAGDEE